MPYVMRTKSELKVGDSVSIVSEVKDNGWTSVLRGEISAVGTSIVLEEIMQTRINVATTEVQQTYFYARITTQARDSTIFRWEV